MKRMQETAQSQLQMQQQQLQMEAQMKQKSPAEMISFKDLPPEGQAQMARQAGIDISTQHIIDHQSRTAAAGQPPQPNVPDVAGGLDKIRQAVPELSHVPDDQLVQFLSQMKAG
jgi:hypothetical protein